MPEQAAVLAAAKRDPVGEIGVGAEVPVEPAVIQRVQIAALVGVVDSMLRAEEILPGREHGDAE